MVARARKRFESFTRYRKNLKEEATWLKYRLSTAYNRNFSNRYFTIWKKVKEYWKKLREAGLAGRFQHEPVKPSRQQMRTLDRSKVKAERKVQRFSRRVARGL